MERIEADVLIPGSGEPVRNGVVVWEGDTITYAWQMKVCPPIESRRSDGRSTIGTSDCGGVESRTVATGARSRRWVSPSAARRTLETIPVVTSDVVGALAEATTVRPSSSTASVLVPPTSLGGEPFQFVGPDRRRSREPTPSACTVCASPGTRTGPPATSPPKSSSL